ncbi:MAG: CHASE2 domain-containing protein, partial [Chlamydiia bacterium]|nr:CHASE2 domain-containing protein [Chlamydiia bacterium]
MVLVLATALFSLFTPPALRTVIDGLNYRMEDAFFHIRGPRKPSGQVVIVDIDQKSLHEIGQWPWPRSYISALLQSLKDAGARCVGFDIVFAEPDRQSLGAWVQRLDYLGHSINISDDEVVDPVHIRRLVLEEWLRRLQDSDPTFQIDPALSPEEKAQLIEAEYLKEQQANWEEAQQTLAARFAAAGLPFSPIPFAVPESTYTEMLKQSREAYYLHRKIGPQGWAYSLLIDNDKALGAAMHDPRVVAGGLFITRQSAGSKIEGYQKKEARRETRG